MKRINKGKLFVISAPSGAGKTTIANTVIEKLGSSYPISKVITYTSRQPRSNEIPGKDYCFVSKDDFFKKKERGFFLETTEYNGEWYGSPQSMIDDLERGFSFIIITDIIGAKTISNRMNTAVLIWLAPPSAEVLRNRLLKRGTENIAQVEARIALSQDEMDQERRENFFHYRVINDSFDIAAKELCEIIKTEIEKG